MPRDVKTRWNSTYDMLKFALEYRKPIDAFCGNRTNGLRACEMDNEEWKIAKQLCDVLSVSMRVRERGKRFNNYDLNFHGNRS